MASQIAIKMLGTNGGGFINANAAHPFENPTPLSNFIQILSIFAIPSALTYYLGRMVKNQKHGWAVWATMFLLFLAGVLTCWAAESAGNPRMHQLGRGGRRRKHGRKGNAFWRFQFRYFDNYNGCFVRRRQLDARFIYADRRPRPRCSTFTWARSFSAASARDCTECWCLFHRDLYRGFMVRRGAGISREKHRGL